MIAAATAACSAREMVQVIPTHHGFMLWDRYVVRLVYTLSSVLSFFYIFKAAIYVVQSC
jgi:hypothetical protein